MECPPKVPNRFRGPKWGQAGRWNCSFEDHIYGLENARNRYWQLRSPVLLCELRPLGTDVRKIREG
jgi:hypothetical protein